MAKQYMVHLTNAERMTLHWLLTAGKAVIVQSLVVKKADSKDTTNGPVPRVSAQEQRHICAASVQVIATPGQQATDTDCRLLPLVAAHRTIALFDPPANPALAAIVGPIHLLAVWPSPRPIAGQLAPQIPAVRKSGRRR